MFIQLLVALANFIISIKTEIILVTNERRNYLASHAQLNNIVSIVRHGSSYSVQFGFAVDDYHLFDLDLHFDPRGYQIRTSKFNTQLQNSSYILFNSNTAALYNNNFTEQQLIYMCLGGESIQEIAFGQSNSQLFILTSELINSTNITYNIYLFNQQLNGTNISIRYSLPSPEVPALLKKLKYKQSSLFIMFNRYFLVYQYNASQQAFFQKYYQQFNQSNDSCLDFDLYNTNDFLLYTDCQNLYSLHTEYFNFTIFDYPLLELANRTSIQIVLAERYLVLLLENVLYQIDFPNNAIIGQFEVSAIEISTIRYLKNIRLDGIGYIVLNSYDSSHPNQQIFLSVQPWYFCLNQTNNSSQRCDCLDNYRFYPRTQKCILIRHRYSGSLPRIVNNNSEFSNPITQQRQKKTRKPENIFSNEMSKQISEGVGVLGNFASLRISPKFIISILSIFDQLFYYQYHQYQYPQTLQYAFTNIQIANKLRFNFIISQILSNLSDFFTQQNFGHSNEKYLIYLHLNETKLTQAYFLSSTQLFYKQNILQCIMLYCTLKLFHFIFYLLLKFSTFFHSIQRIFRYQTKWWTLIVSILQGNIVSLAFYSTIQFSLPSHYIFENKINFIVLLFFFFFVIIYSFAFYPIISRNNTKQETEILLIKCRFVSQSFVFEPYCFIFRAILKSIIHGLFLSNYQLQIIQLLISDVPFLLAAIYYRKLFLNCFVFLFVIVYLVTTFALNLFFVMEVFFTRNNFMNVITYFEAYRETYLQFILYVLVGSTVMISFTILTSSAIDQIKNIFKIMKNNSILPATDKKKGQQENRRGKRIEKPGIIKMKDPNISEKNFKIFISRRKGRSSPNITNIKL